MSVRAIGSVYFVSNNLGLKKETKSYSPYSSLYFPFPIFCCCYAVFCGAADGTQGLMHVKQVLYH